MAQRLVTSFINTNIPGAYPNVSVKSNPVGLGASGIVVILGEADGGDSYQNVALKDNSFTPDQLDRVQQQYISGQIVDAFRAFSAPSNDADIVGTANRIFILKTNQSSKASAIVDTDYGTLSDQNWGVNGNKIKFLITTTDAEVAPTVSGIAVPAFGASLNAATFDVRLNGLVKTTITLSANPVDHADIATLIVELNALLPVGIVASAGTVTNSLKLTMAVDAAANRKGWGKSFELFETSPGDLASLGLVEALNVSSQEPAVEIAITRSDIGLSETLDVSATVALKIGYVGTTATLTISGNSLTTAIVGGSGAALAIDLTQFRTLSDLAAFISAQTGYSAEVIAAAQQLAPSALDEVAAIGICSSDVGLTPGRIKIAASNWQKAIATSQAVSFTVDAEAGLPSTMSVAVFLSGGARGNTLAADIIAAIGQLAGIQVNIIVPLFSRDATADIADSLTSSGSTYTIDAIHAAVKNHCVQYSTPKLKRNRIAVLSYSGAYSDAKVKAQSLANYRISMTMQKATQVDSSGNIVSFLPWYGACVAAGMQAGGF